MIRFIEDPDEKRKISREVLEALTRVVSKSKRAGKSTSGNLQAGLSGQHMRMMLLQVFSALSRQEMRQ